METGARLFVEALKRENVEVIFGLPGGALIELYDALYDETDIQHILVRHEQCAAHAADGYARASGKVGVCMATSGPGATNLVTGIATAYLDSSPVVAVTGQVPRKLIGRDAFQEADTLGIMMPITKYNMRVNSAREIPYIVRKAFKIAKTGRPGPVHIDLPRDVQQEVAEPEFPEDVDLPGYKPTYEGHPLQIKKAARLLAEAERPIILAGGGTIISGATQELIELAEMLGAGVATTLMGKGAFPESHPLALGMIGMHGRKAANYAVTECDVLLAVGCRFSDRSTGDVRYFAPDAKKIHIDIDPAEIGKNVEVDLPIVGDCKRVLRGIIDELKKIAQKKERTAWLNRIRELKSSYEPRMDYDDIPLKPQRVMKEIMEAIDPKDIITTEVGQCQMWAAHYLTREHPRTFITSGGLGTMGFGFPASIGAKVARPDVTVLDVAGDGSFLMVCQDLATAVEYEIPVIVCVLDNRYLGMVKQWQKLFFNERYSEVHLGEVPDFVKLAEAFGARGVRATRPGDVKKAIEEAKRENVPTVIDVIIDPEEDVLPMVPAGGRIDKMIG